jgi:quinol monooxygenase YgiN
MITMSLTLSLVPDFMRHEDHRRLRTPHYAPHFGISIAMTTPLVLVAVPAHSIPEAELIPTCRKLIQYDGDWLFLTSTKSIVALQLNNHNNPLSATNSLVHETVSPFTPNYATMTLEPSIGFISRSGQTIPSEVHTTIVKYRCISGSRPEVIDLCRDLFDYNELEELDVYSLAMLTSVENKDEFVILERYEDAEAEKRHLVSERCVKCLKEIRGMIAGNESINYRILDV